MIGVQWYTMKVKVLPVQVFTKIWISEFGRSQIPPFGFRGGPREVVLLHAHKIDIGMMKREKIIGFRKIGGNEVAVAPPFQRGHTLRLTVSGVCTNSVDLFGMKSFVSAPSVTFESSS